MYSPSRAHSPVHRLHSRPPTSYRRFLPSSRSFRLHPIFLIPIFLLGTLFSPFNPHSSSNNTTPEPIYRKQDYEFNPQVAFAEPDAPPLLREQDSTGGIGIGRNVEKVLARAGHGQGEDESEWWDPTTSPSNEESSTSSSIYYEREGLVYFPTTPSLIPPLSPIPEFPLPKPKPPPIAKRPPLHEPPLGPPPPVPFEWLSPGDLFKPLYDRKQSSSSSSRYAALNAALPPKPKNQPGGGIARRVPLRDRISPAEREALKRKIGVNAQKAQMAKKEGKGFKPGKPEELVAKEKKLRDEKERIRKEEENKRFREAVWQVVEPKKAMVVGAGGKVLGVQEEEEIVKDEEVEDDGEGEDLSDEEILKAVRELSEAERKMLSPEEQEVIRELELKYPPTKVIKNVVPVPRNRPPNPAAAAGAPRRPPLQQQQQHQRKVAVEQGQRRGNFRDRAQGGGGGGGAQHEKKVGFNPLVPGRAAGGVPQQQPLQQGRRRGGLRKRSIEIVEEEPKEDVEESEEDASSQFIRRALDDEHAHEDAPSLSNSDRSKNGQGRPIEDRLHPISYLIEEAEDRWESMLRRQSQTLEQAVEEYTRRYGMAPPVGFDSWWRYAMENRVILVDEYDQIYQDILPFLSLGPKEFKRRSQQLQTDGDLPWFKHSFGLGIKTGVVKKFAGVGATEAGNRIEDLMDILGEFSEMMPEDVEMRFMSGDEPGVVVSGEAKVRHEHYAEEGRFLTERQAIETLEPTGFTPWDSLCKPNSTARRLAQALPIDKPVGTNLRSFVNLEHEKAMDLCHHPEARTLNGFTSWSGPRPYLLYPMFSFTKTSMHSDLLVPSFSNDFYTEVGKDPTWEGKRHNKVLWRGETTGAWHAQGSGWRNTQRARLVALANAPRKQESLVHFASPSNSDSIRRSTVPTTSLTSFYLDVAYSGGPVQCSIIPQDKTCDALTTDPELRWDPKGGLTNEEENQYKYVLDVDANYPSGKFKRLMSSRSLVFKSTIFPEWWTKRIMPWYHYVPIRSDYSDLLDVSAYFIGAPDRTGSHDQIAKKLALRGQRWSNEHWREVDMAAYMFRLYLEYARLLHRDENDPASMDYSP